ncbi:MAG: hypothetical protein L0H79_13015, partial [Intrasporangium sp.]|uniref:hypothetical protein n=1 Tax=Intrasporangium sp. TaxID=1925024 RepID=UPI002648D66C
MIGLLYWLVYVAGVVQVCRVAERAGQPRCTWWGVTLWLAVAIPSSLQFWWPELLARGARDPAEIGQGQWWRLVTSMFLQDGGWPGTIFNLVTLAITVLLTGSLVRGWVLPVLFVLGGVVCNVLTALAFDQSGAGDSMATMVLLVVVAIWSTRPVATDLALVALLVATAVTLLFLRDQHGLAVSFGMVLGVASRRPARSAWARVGATRGDSAEQVRPSGAGVTERPGHAVGRADLSEPARGFRAGRAVAAGDIRHHLRARGAGHRGAGHRGAGHRGA